MDFNYYSANVGMRSAIMDFRRSDEMARFRQLVAGADIFFANRRPGLLEKLGITSSELARLRPGIVQVDFSIYGAVGPWANRIGFDQSAGGVSLRPGSDGIGLAESDPTLDSGSAHLPNGSTLP